MGANGRIGAIALAVILLMLALTGTALAAPANGEKYAGVPADSKARSPIAAAYEAFIKGDPTALSAEVRAAGDVSAATVTRYEETDPAFSYTGAWMAIPDTWASGAGFVSSNEVGATCSFSFVGFSATWIATKYSPEGSADVYLDGVKQATVNLRSTTTAYQVAVWSTGTISYGAHTVEIVLPPASGPDNYVNVDAFDVSTGIGSISGKVTNSSGTGLANVTVAAIDSSGVVGQTTTSSSGAYSIRALPSVPVVVVTSNKANYIDEWYNDIPVPGHLEAEGATWLDLSADPTRAGINFSLASGKYIKGYVRDYRGHTLTNFEVDVYDTSGNLFFLGVTTASGSYSLGGLPAGSYHIQTVNDQGYIDEWYGGDPVVADPYAASATLINISTSSASGKNFSLYPGRIIDGRVYSNSSGRGLAGAYVRFIFDYVGGGEYWAKTDGGGNFALYGVLPGKYVACSANDQGYIDEWYYNDPAPADISGANSMIVDVTDGDETGINFGLDKGYTISGTVTDNGTGDALSDRDVVEVFDTTGKLYAGSYVGGEYGASYTTWALPSGSYYVRTNYGGTADYVDEWYDNKEVGVYDHTGADPVALAASNVTGIDFGLDKLTRYEQTDPHIYYTPAWTSLPATAASGGSYSYSTAKTAVATVYFYGTRLDVVGVMGSTAGSADFYVDNVKTDTVSLAASSAEYDVNVFTTGILANGSHRVDLKYVSSNATGKRMSLDAVDVAGVLTYVVPMITRLTPSTGFTLGGDTVVITGDNLTGATAVTFGGTPAAGIHVDSATQITAVTPAGSPGTVDVQMTTPSGTTATSAADHFTYVAPGAPTITSVSPAGGSVAGGSTVVITGTNFAGLSGASAVQFDGVNATSYVRNSGTQITAVAPAHASEGAVDVRVTAAGGTTAISAADQFTYSNITRYDAPLANTNIVRTGTWADYASAPSCGSSYSRSSTAGASATVWFTGTQIAYVAFKGTTTASVDIYIDNAKQTTVNLAATVATPAQTVWTSPTLTNSLHSFKIVRTSTDASGKYITLDALDITGTIAPPPTLYQQTDAHIVYAPAAWSTFSSSSASGSSYARSLASGASATITFTGTRLDYIGMKGTSAGWVDIYLDGTLMTPSHLNLHATSASYQQVLWSSGALANGLHTVRIVRDDADSGTTLYANLDAVDIWGTIK